MAEINNEQAQAFREQLVQLAAEKRLRAHSTLSESIYEATEELYAGLSKEQRAALPYRGCPTRCLGLIDWEAEDNHYRDCAWISCRECVALCNPTLVKEVIDKLYNLQEQKQNSLNEEEETND